MHPYASIVIRMQYSTHINNKNATSVEIVKSAWQFAEAKQVRIQPCKANHPKLVKTVNNGDSRYVRSAVGRYNTNIPKTKKIYTNTGNRFVHQSGLDESSRQKSTI